MIIQEDLSLKFHKPLNYKLIKEEDCYRLQIETQNGWKSIDRTPTGTYLPISQYFGANDVGFYDTLGWKGHNGIDFKAPTGSYVYSLYDGTCLDYNEEAGFISIWTDEMMAGNGDVVKLRIVYGHLDHSLVKIGDRVKSGEIIAISDNKGKYTTGAHLHINVMPYYLKNGSFQAIRTKEQGYDGAIDFIKWLPDLTVKYELMFKKLERDELIDYFAKVSLSGISNKDFEKLKAGDETMAQNVRRQMIKNITNSPLAVILTEQNGEVWVEEK